jgi:hypothetical protein
MQRQRFPSPRNRLVHVILVMLYGDAVGQLRRTLVFYAE